ncbi:alpha/beta fold hydrolase [Pseudomonadota bacterium]
MNKKEFSTSNLQTVQSFDGNGLSCEIRGSGNRPLVFVHGWTCNRDFFAPQADYFSKTHQVVSLDLAGHGQSEGGRTDWTLQNFARDVEAVVKSLALEAPVLIGHSMGGAVCLEAARLLDKQISGVVLADTFAFDYGRFDESQIKQFLDSFRNDFKGAIKGLVEQTTPEGTDPELREKMISAMSSVSPSMAVPAFESLLRWDALPLFDALNTSVRCINGSLINKDACLRYASYWQDVVMPEAGHFLQLEDPEGFNRHLNDMLGTL